ncbi:MAG: nitrous oxide reductase family maturation protein NosD [Candidatus Sifarchaeia archaeon]
MRLASLFLVTCIVGAPLISCTFFTPAVFVTPVPHVHHSSIQSTYIESSPFSINGNVDFAFQAAAKGWIGNGSETNPYLIQNLNISSTSGSIILASISNTNVHFRIEGSIFSGGSTAIVFSNVTNGIVFNNTIGRCSVGGASISDSLDIRFENNSISQVNETGIGVYWYKSHNSSISNNTIESRCIRGILMDYSTNCSIFYNDISFHSVSGIKLRDSDSNRIQGNRIHHNNYSGITFGNANFCNLTDNIIFNNDEQAIDLQESSHALILHNLIYNHPKQGVRVIGHSSTIQNNTFYNNSVWALQLDSSGVNILYNNFIENGKHIFGGGDVEDHTESNNYDYNHWSEWTTPDRDNDMIVDIPRYITNTEGKYDYHPVTVPYIDLRLHIISEPNIIVPDNDVVDIHTSYNVTWIPSGDTFGHTIKYSLYYTVDESIWVQVAAGLTVNYHFWDLAFLPDKTNVTLKATASCSYGYNATSYSNTHIVIEHTIRGLAIFSPAGGKFYFDEVRIDWGSEGCTVNDDVFYNLYYSNDGGISWSPIVEDLMSDETSYLWNVLGKPSGSNYLIKVVAECSQGFTVEVITHDTFTISPWAFTLDNPFWKVVIGIGISLSVVVILIHFIRRYRNNS